MKTALFLALIFAPAIAHSQGFQDADPMKAARAVIILGYGAPCGEVSGAIRTPQGNLVAECTNGLKYGARRVGSNIELLQFNGATGQWTSYAR